MFGSVLLSLMQDKAAPGVTLRQNNGAAVSVVMHYATLPQARVLR